MTGTGGDGDGPRGSSPWLDPSARDDDAGDPDNDPWSSRLTRARALEILFARFRTAGLDLVPSYRFGDGDLAVTLDGYDEGRRVGYAFVSGEPSADDSGIDSEAERRLSRLSRVGTSHVLVIRESDVPSAEALERVIDAFFTTLPR